MPAATLSTRALNRALLARQSLLERSSLPIPRTLESIAGLQTQYAPSAYVGLWSRLHGFERSQLTAALTKGRIVQGTLMRVTIHMVSARDYPLLTEGVRQARREWWLRVARSRRLEAHDYEALGRLLETALADGPRSRKDLIALIAEHGYPKEAWEGAGLWLDMIRVPPSGTWERRRADLYGLASHVVGSGTISEEQGLRHLVRRYLGGFGPATAADIAGWAGVPTLTLRPVLERMRLRRYHDENGNELVDLSGQKLPDADTPAPIRFLPTWDATLLAHARRTGILPEDYRPHVFHTKNPQSLNTFLVDGMVAGSWRHQEGSIQLEPFHPLPRRARRDLEEESTRLAALYTG